MTRASSTTIPFLAAPEAINPSAPTTVADRWKALNRSVTPALATLSVMFWLVGLHPIVPSQMGSLGLINQLSPILLLSYPTLLAAVVIELVADRPRERLLTAYAAAGVLFIYGLQPASEQTARLSVAWLHVGFAQYIAAHGQVLHGYDGRFSWPGFFSLVAFVSRASGQTDMTPLLQWAPAALAGLAILGMRALATAVLGSGRRAWVATWLFLLTQWTEQDYFSPQAVTYVLMFGALALTARYLVRALPTTSPRAGLRDRLVPFNTPRERLAAQAAILLIALALAPSHQLTLFVLGGLLLVMFLTGWLWPAWLPWMALILSLLWFCLGAKDFWKDHLDLVLGHVGQINYSVQQGLGQRFIGDTGRIVILTVRVALTCAVGVLAATGWWSLHRRTARSWTLPLLAIAPLGLIILQSYGGEVFLRCYLFALPFAAILAGVGVDVLLTRTWLGSRRTALAVPVALLTVLALATVTARGGNDAYTSFSRADLAAVDYAYQHAADGQSISALTADLPLGYTRIGAVRPLTVEATCPDIAAIAGCILAQASDFLVVTPAQENAGQILYGFPAGWTSRLVHQLVTSGKYRLVYDQDGGRVLAETHGAPHG
jgi:hypothetical protein